MQEVTAWLAEMQAMVTVWPGVESGKPGKKSEKILWKPSKSEKVVEQGNLQ